MGFLGQSSVGPVPPSCLMTPLLWLRIQPHALPKNNKAPLGPGHGEFQSPGEPTDMEMGSPNTGWVVCAGPEGDKGHDLQRGTRQRPRPHRAAKSPPKWAPCPGQRPSVSWVMVGLGGLCHDELGVRFGFPAPSLQTLAASPWEHKAPDSLASHQMTFMLFKKIDQRFLGRVPVCERRL